jgi:hypothetical protein
MISIPIRSNSDPPEWFMVELQGEIVQCREGEPGQAYNIGVFSASTTVRILETSPFPRSDMLN